MPSAQPVYRPRDAEHTVLYEVVREHLDAFLRAAEAGDESRGLPSFIEREFREFLTCGILAHGFVRFRCEGCALERLVPFSCKGRGFCPSCGGRRMTERAAHLLDAVLPWVPVRQWVLRCPTASATCWRGTTSWPEPCWACTPALCWISTGAAPSGRASGTAGLEP